MKSDAVNALRRKRRKRQEELKVCLTFEYTRGRSLSEREDKSLPRVQQYFQGYSKTYGGESNYANKSTSCIKLTVF